MFPSTILRIFSDYFLLLILTDLLNLCIPKIILLYIYMYTYIRRYCYYTIFENDSIHLEYYKNDLSDIDLYETRIEGWRRVGYIYRSHGSYRHSPTPPNRSCKWLWRPLSIDPTQNLPGSLSSSFNRVSFCCLITSDTLYDDFFSCLHRVTLMRPKAKKIIKKYTVFFLRFLSFFLFTEKLLINLLQKRRTLSRYFIYRIKYAGYQPGNYTDN